MTTFAHLAEDKSLKILMASYDVPPESLSFWSGYKKNSGDLFLESNFLWGCSPKLTVFRKVSLKSSHNAGKLILL